MTTHTTTTEWVFSPELSTLPGVNYFENRVNGRFLAEMKASGGFEYYSCTEEQARLGLVGTYLGSKRSDAADGREAGIMVYDHDSQTERNLTFDDSEYLR